MRTTSPGEELWLALRELYARTPDGCPTSELFALTTWVEPSGALAHFFADVTLSLAVYKIIKAGKRIESEDGLEGNLLHSHEGEELFLQRMREYLVEFLGISFSDRGGLRIIPDLALRSIRISRHVIEQTARARVLNEAASMAPDGRIRCYCCGADLLFQSGGVRRNIPLDHIWPRSLGGVSAESNLLPVCENCNGAKTDRLSWSIFGVVQDYAAATQSEDADLLLSLALRRRAATKLAEEQYITLKQAFLLLGPAGDLSSIYPGESRLFFNLMAHDRTHLSSLW
ncbi:HNH endonuclease [Paraburkholderia sp. BL27I4N3]|uniref:HNH endonuclease n=1 Tax=Paraburkholderia sp. BL27I4N3 TaxID=1938805 RepID=UPI000E3A35F2|nr:HNH endonuclease [Paraburkholderia sp. BL27I4N3]REE17153.1 HNH endonuclease [Paraburkholderia sp. BL27I4N3]